MMSSNSRNHLLFVQLIVVVMLTSNWSLSANGQQSTPPVLDAETRLAWHAQHLKMRSESPFSSLKWQFIGPELMSGRVTDIAAPADQPFTFYVATASGGVWKTVNEGTTWIPIFDDAPSASVGAIAVAPTEPETVWVGLGEANIFRSSMSGTGVYRSKDGGQNWEHMGLPESQHIARIVVHPEDPNIVYVAASGHEYTPNTERGIYKSTNCGITWERVHYVNEHVAAIDLVMDPNDPNTLFAAMWNRTRHAWSDPLPGPDDGIFRSTDGGENWELLTEGLPDYKKTGRIGLAIAASRPNVVYALIDNHESARQADEGERDSYGRLRANVIKGAEVFRSDDRGDSWNKVSESDRTMERLFSTYGWVFGQIRVDPSDENNVFIMGVPLLRSKNGGKKFDRVNFPELHGDHHAMWINPNNSKHIINGNDGGINLSYDGGETWKNVENLPVVQFYNVVVDNAKPFRVYGSIQDNNSWRGPSDYRPGRSQKTDWQRVPGGEASQMAIDPEDENIFYSEGFYGSIQRSTLEPRRTKNIIPKAAEGEPPLRGQWLAPFTLSPHNSRIIYHGMQYVFRSLDRGESWERISGDLTFNDPTKQGNISFATIFSLCESPLKFGLVYAGTDDGRLHVTKNGGVQWNEIMEGLPRKWVSRVVASRYEAGTVYATLNGKRDDDFQTYVYRSRDYGKTWEDISEGIPGGPVNVIVEDPNNQSILYVGTDMGVYVTLDGADSWQVLGTELPITFVHDLAIQERDKVMVAATHGRGMYKIRLRGVYSKKRELDNSADSNESESAQKDSSESDKSDQGDG